MSTAVQMHVPMQEENFCLKVLAVEVQIATISNKIGTISKLPTKSRLFFMPHLLVNRVIVMATARKTVERFCFLKCTG